MGRSPLIVKEEELRKVITELEAVNTYATQGELFEAVANTDWGKGVRNANWRVKGIKAPVVYQKVREYGIVVKTVKGKRGRVTGQPVNRRARSEKMDNPDVKYAVQQLRDDINLIGDDKERLLGMVDKIEAGSVNMAVKLKCMECHGYEGKTYKECNAPCPLRPINLIFWPRKHENV